jgi:hypothetical protein
MIYVTNAHMIETLKKFAAISAELAQELIAAKLPDHDEVRPEDADRIVKAFKAVAPPMSVPPYE